MAIRHGISRRHGPSAGFTLLEILVALVVLGFLMAGLSQGVRFGLQAWDVQTRKLAVGSDMDAIDRALRRLIEQADPGEQGQESPFNGGAHTLGMVTRLPASATGGPTPDAKVGIGVDGGHRLVLRSAPQPNAELLGAAPRGSETVLLENVDHISFAYWKGGPKSGWSTTWSDPDLPGLVRISIGFRAGDRRHWPDLLATPMRVRAES
jgi:general secretion pathway protein J